MRNTICPKIEWRETASCGVSLVPSAEERKSQQMAEGTRETQQLGRRDSLSDSRYNLEAHSAREKFQSSTTFRPLFQTSQILQTHVMLKKAQARGPRPTRSESKLLSRCFSTMGGLNGIFGKPARRCQESAAPLRLVPRSGAELAPPQIQGPRAVRHASNRRQGQGSTQQ